MTRLCSLPLLLVAIVSVSFADSPEAETALVQPAVQGRPVPAGAAKPQAAGLIQHVVQGQPDPDVPPVIKLTLQPAAPPAAALKFQLLPPYLDRTVGNAAPLYYRAVVAMKTPDHLKNQQQLADWLEKPLKEMPRDEARKLLAGYRAVLEETHAGARRDRCDWEIPIRGNRELISIRLEEIQESRAIARLLAVQARLQILDGKYGDAVQTLQTGYALARHVAEMPFLVSGLVGLAISAIMSERIQEMAEMPGSPNLYWTLTMLPRPLIDLAPAMQVEMVIPYQMFPFLRDAETTERSPAQWQTALDELQQRIIMELGPLERQSTWPPRLMMTAVALKAFPIAKQHLIAKGYPAEKVDTMPVAQVIAIYTADTYDELRDEMFKWFNVPYWQAKDGINRAEQALQPFGKGREIVPLASLLLPAIGRANFAPARGDRRICELRVIEALRLYAAGHDGKLPAKLADITEVPIPIDPITGKEFDYRLEGDTAILEVHPPAGMSPRAHGKRYQLTIARKP